MSKHHVTPDGPGDCNADKGRCPYGGESGEENHYATREEAQAQFDKSMEAQKFSTATKKHKVESPHGKTINDLTEKLHQEQKRGYFAIRQPGMVHKDVVDHFESMGYTVTQSDYYGTTIKKEPKRDSEEPKVWPRYDSGPHIDSSEARRLAKTLRAAEEALPKAEQRLRDYEKAGAPNNGYTTVGLNNQISDIKMHLNSSRKRLEERRGDYLSDAPGRKTIRVNNRAQKAMLEGPMKDSLKDMGDVDVVVDTNNPGCNFEVGEGLPINRGKSSDDDIRRTVSSSYAGTSYPDVDMDRDIADMKQILSTERPNYTVPSHYL